MAMTNAEWCLKNNINFTELTVRNKKGGGYGIKNVRTGKDIDTYMAKNKETGFEIFRRWLDAEHKEQILDDAEREYLSAVIKPFRDKVEYITKKPLVYKEYIYIHIYVDNIMLPRFKEGTMYKGMKICKAYTPEELGL